MVDTAEQWPSPEDVRRMIAADKVRPVGRPRKPRVVWEPLWRERISAGAHGHGIFATCYRLPMGERILDVRFLYPWARAPGGMRDTQAGVYLDADSVRALRKALDTYLMVQEKL